MFARFHPMLLDSKEYLLKQINQVKIKQYIIIKSLSFCTTLLKKQLMGRMHVILVVICLTKFLDDKQKPENGSISFWIYGQNTLAEKAFPSRGKHDNLIEFGTCIKLIKRNTVNSKKTLTLHVIRQYGKLKKLYLNFYEVSYICVQRHYRLSHGSIMYIK